MCGYNLIQGNLTTENVDYISLELDQTRILNTVTWLNLLMSLTRSIPESPVAQTL